MVICSSVQLMHWWFYFAGAVVEAFVRLHDKGLIYQGRIIYYSCPTTKECVCAWSWADICVGCSILFFFNYYIFLFFENLSIVIVTYNTLIKHITSAWGNTFFIERLPVPFAPYIEDSALAYHRITDKDLEWFACLACLASLSVTLFVSLLILMTECCISRVIPANFSKDLSWRPMSLVVAQRLMLSNCSHHLIVSEEFDHLVGSVQQPTWLPITVSGLLPPMDTSHVGCTK